MSLAFPKPQRLELPAYLKFIRQHPCVVKGCWKRTEASHVIFNGQGRMGSKVNDTQTLPKCRQHHEEYAKIGRVAFEANYGLDLAQLIIQFLTEYITRAGIDR